MDIKSNTKSPPPRTKKKKKKKNFCIARELVLPQDSGSDW